MNRDAFIKLHGNWYARRLLTVMHAGGFKVRLQPAGEPSVPRKVDIESIRNLAGDLVDSNAPFVCAMTNGSNERNDEKTAGEEFDTFTVKQIERCKADTVKRIPDKWALNILERMETKYQMDRESLVRCANVIACLDRCDYIGSAHMAEALQYAARERI